jgi:hypothetical protein
MTNGDKKLKTVQVDYFDLTQHQNVKYEEIKTLGMKMLTIWGQLHSEERDFIRVITEYDHEGEENDVMIIPTSLVIKKKILK